MNKRGQTMSHAMSVCIPYGYRYKTRQSDRFRVMEGLSNQQKPRNGKERKNYVNTLYCTVSYKSDARVSVILLENSPLSAVHAEWQYYGLDYQNYVHICSVRPVCLGRKEFGCRHSPSLLMTHTRPSLVSRQNLLLSENKTDLHFALQWALVDNTAVSNGNEFKAVEYTI
ncbi:hypothetical protein TNCV_3183891 [Trichonephila clavipes]|nr:hypothetical protein TNCV_3183891 [Trichonephila clavipes]